MSHWSSCSMRALPDPLARAILLPPVRERVDIPIIDGSLQRSDRSWRHVSGDCQLDQLASSSNVDARMRLGEAHRSTLNGGQVAPGTSEARILIFPGKGFHVVDQLFTNFHLPRSSLLAMVAAFAGKENVLGAYRHAVESGYRFYSYGDCMFIR